MKKKLVAILLVAAMVLSLVACGEKKGGTDTPGTPSTGDKTDAGKKYTYHAYLTNAQINSFSPTDWQTNAESQLMGVCIMDLYDFRYNPDAKNEYELVPEMAAAMPEDVTAQYAGQYGIPADATEGYAWKVTLRQDLKWDDGTPITSADYVYTVQQFINPEMKNYRADSYTGNVGEIYNANKYFEGTFGAAAPRGKQWSDVVKGADGKYTIDGHEAFLAWGMTTTLVGGDSLIIKDYASKYGMSEETYNWLDGLADARGAIELTDEVIEKFFEWTSSDDWGNEPEDDLIGYIAYDDPAMAVTWDEVGYFADGDYAFVQVFANPCIGFYLYYGGLHGDLVKKDLYEANKKQVGALVKSSYGTSVDTFASYGPYKMDQYQEGKYAHFTKNENWYGYTDGNHEGMYQTTDLDFQVVEEQSTRLSLFLQGKLDDVDLVSDNLPDYGLSEYTYYVPESYNAEFAWNTNYDVLKSRETEGVCKTIFCNINWRKAFALSLDRQEYCKSCTSGFSASFGIISDYYIYDPENLAKYRATPQAQACLCDVYGANSVDELSGYDIEEARRLLQVAYDECYAAGDIKDGDMVVVEFHIRSAEPENQRAVDFCTNSMLKAAEGTSLEGRIKFELIADPDFYNNAKQGACDFIKENWGGAAMNPFTMMGCYCTDKSNEFGFKYGEYKATINVNGENIEKTMYDWYVSLLSGEYANADADTRLAVLSGMEKALLLYYHIVPVASYTTPNMRSQRVTFGADHFVNALIVFAQGVQYIKYSMDDAEWEEYCKQQNNQLTY